MGSLNSSKLKNFDYCILYRDEKGYYLSKTEIAQSMNLNIVEKGDKKYCEKQIQNLNQPTKQ